MWSGVRGGRWRVAVVVVWWADGGRGTYPHALHAAHGPERAQRAERSHRFERLNAAGATKRRYEVYKRDLMESRVTC